MELLIFKHDKNFVNDKVDGYILPIEDFSVSYPITYTLEEIEDDAKKHKVFVLINKNIQNKEITRLEETLKKLSEMNIGGVLFYDISILSIVRRLGLNLELIWNQTHMVTNYNTIDYYYQKGARGAYLSNEITLEEMLEIRGKVKSKLFVSCFYEPVVSFSKRHLIDNYYKSMGKVKESSTLTVHERVSNQDYLVLEEENGTTFISKTIVNGSRPLLDLRDVGVDYAVIDVRNNDVSFLIDSAYSIIHGEENEELLKNLEEKLGNHTGFFYKKTIYRVK